jgi:hypothetical protein
VQNSPGRPLLSTDVVQRAIVPAPEERPARGVHPDRLHAPRPSGSRSSPARGAVRGEARLLLLDPADRHALLAQRDLLGLLPDQLRKRHPDLWQENSNDERTKNRYERQLLDFQLERQKATPEKPVKYMKIYEADEAQATRRQINSFSGLALVSMVFNFLDILAHGRSESEILQELAPDEAAFRAVMKAWFTHSPLYDIFRALSRQDCTVVLTTDHGAVLGKRAALVYGNRDTSTNLRYKFGLNLNTDPKQAIIVRRPRTSCSRRRREQELRAGARGLLLRLPDPLPRVRAPVPQLVPARRHLGRGDDPAAGHARAPASVSAGAAAAARGRTASARRPNSWARRSPRCSRSATGGARGPAGRREDLLRRWPGARART